VKDLEAQIREAVRFFWLTREGQAKKQGKKDAGDRSSVTGGKQMDGFVDLLCGMLGEAGFPRRAFFGIGECNCRDGSAPRSSGT
jgi:hypothetical protein